MKDRTLTSSRWLDRARRTIQRLHRDDRGTEALEKLLIIAAIILPLLALLIVFRGNITDWVKGYWTQVKGDAKDYNPSLP